MGEWLLHSRWPSDSAPSELDWFHGYDVVGHRLRAGGQRAARRCRDASRPLTGSGLWLAGTSALVAIAVYLKESRAIVGDGED